MLGRRTRAAAAALSCAALLAGAASALAAHPKKSAHFSGSFGFAGVNGFKPPVSFSVSKNGKTLTGFAYSTLGCFGAGGFQKGVNYYTKPEAIVKVGTVKVSSSGHFSAGGVVWKYSNKFGVTTTTTTTLSGSFSKAKAASGTVSFAQKLSGKTTGACESQALSFSAKAR
jgi:hypothetical protein